MFMFVRFDDLYPLPWSVLFSKRISMAYDGVTRYVGQFMHLRYAIQDFFHSYILLRFCLS